MEGLIKARSYFMYYEMEETSEADTNVRNTICSEFTKVGKYLLVRARWEEWREVNVVDKAEGVY